MVVTQDEPEGDLSLSERLRLARLCERVGIDLTSFQQYNNHRELTLLKTLAAVCGELEASKELLASLLKP